MKISTGTMIKKLKSSPGYRSNSKLCGSLFSSHLHQKVILFKLRILEALIMNIPIIVNNIKLNINFVLITALELDEGTFQAVIYP